MARTTWGIDDPLFRGDDKDGVRPPNPEASSSIVRHVLYLEGAGRETPYASTSEDEDAAQHFAGSNGRLWFTCVERINDASLRYIPKVELLDLLRGKGKGDAAWPKAYEVQRARAYVEEWGEHLVDFRILKGRSPLQIREIVSSVFTKERP